ncbi:MAG TPA: FCD domain-containing protein, partial [Naasia sp.]
VVAELATGSPALADAEALLDAMDEAAGAPGAGHGEFLPLDTRFHTSLAEATGNQVIAAVMSGLRGAIESYVTEGAAALPDWTATSTRLRAEHRAILAAIRSGDAGEAEALVARHIADYYAETRLSPAPDAQNTTPSPAHLPTTGS